MEQKRLGVAVSAPDSSTALTNIANLEQRGIPAAWLTSAGARGADPLGVFVGAALRTQHILLGTAITQTFPRHPIVAVQQVLVLAQLAPGCFRLGLGTSGRAGTEQTYGVNFRAPLGHLREYLRTVKALLHTGSVDFAGRYYQARTSIAAPVDVPVMAAALGARAYELCGASPMGPLAGCALDRTCEMSRCQPSNEGWNRERLIWHLESDTSVHYDFTKNRRWE